MPLFDAYIFIDWSAANNIKPLQPAPDAVWSGEYVPALNHQLETYHRTRHDAYTHVLAFALRQISEGRRVLLGFDFPYGYPHGFSQALGMPNGPLAWSSIWADFVKRIQDTANNRSNRFLAASDLNAQISAGQGPFWGCPANQMNGNLSMYSPNFPFQTQNGTVLPSLRISESRLNGTQSTWKLYGAGSVGSQALVGIPYVYRLRHHAQLQHCSKVWPFETQFTNAPSPNAGPYILHAEIWPGVVRRQANDLLAANQQMIPDRAQVRAMCDWASGHDIDGNLGQYFAAPQNLTPAQVQVCTEQEGWVLGGV